MWLVVVGALLLWAYDAAPRALKELGLGEVAAFVVWGPLMVAGGYFVLSGIFSAGALLASVPYGLGVMSILVGKHIDQRQFDASKHQRTLPVVLGEGRARVFNRPLGSRVALFASPRLAHFYRKRFPNSLTGAPFLLPMKNFLLRQVMGE